MRSRPVFLIICLALLVACLGAGLSSASAADDAQSGDAEQRRDRDCGDFSNQAAAQDYFLSIGGPYSDPDRLDVDHDGIACESLPCPCNYSTASPSPTPTATLTPSPSATTTPSSTPTVTSTPSTSTTPSATTSPTATPSETATTGPADIPGGQPMVLRLRKLISLLVVAEAAPGDDYDREAQFGDWVEQGDGCDTRAVVLRTESLRQTEQVSACTITTGKWISLYNGKTYRNAYGGLVQIDHVVPVKNAWISGAVAWTQATRVDFYNDLADPRALVAVDGPSNSAKGDSSPDQWLPAVNKCLYVEYYAVTKYRWALSTTQAEKASMTSLAGTCQNVRVRLVTATVDYSAN